MGFLPGRPGDRSNLKHRHGGAKASVPGGSNCVSETFRNRSVGYEFFLLLWKISPELLLPTDGLSVDDLDPSSPEWVACGALAP